MSAVDVARAAADRASAAADRARAAANVARDELRNRTTALEVARAALAGAEDAFDASPSETSGQVVIDLRAAHDLCGFLVTRAAERLAPLQAAATSADKARNEALFVLRAAESADAPPEQPVTLNRAALEQQARLGNEYAARKLGIERLPLINGQVAKPSPDFLDRAKQALDALLGGAP